MRVRRGARAGRSRAGRAPRARGCRSARARRSIRSTPVPQLVQLRAERVRRGRPHDVDRDRADTCKPGNCRLYITPAGGGDLADEERADRSAELGVPGRPARDQRGRRGHDRPERRDGQHRLRRHRRGQHLRLRLRGGRRHLQVDERRRHVDRPARRLRDRHGNPLAGKGVGEIVVKPGYPEHDLRRRRRPRSAACRRSAARASRGRSRAPRSGASTSRPNGGASWTLHPQRRRRTTAALHRATRPSSTTAASARRAACATSRSTRRTRRSSTRRSYARGVWRSPDGGATWTQIKPSLNAAVIQTRPAIAVTTLAERQDAHVRLRGQHRQPRTPALPQRRRRRPAPRCSPT